MVALRAVAIVPAAGSSRRFGGGTKLFRQLSGRPVLVRTLQQLSRVSAIRQIVVVTRSRHIPRIRRLVAQYRLRKVVDVVQGGATRMVSVSRGLHVADATFPLVVIHDGARPLVPVRVIREAIHAARRSGAAVAAIPVADTMKELVGRRLRTLARQSLWAAQTPQVFHTPLVRRAYARAVRAGVVLTDDAAAVERLGRHVAISPGDPMNMKITYARDLRIAAALLKG